MSPPSSFDVVLVTEDFPPILGGVATFLSQLARHTHFRVIVLAPDVPHAQDLDANQPFAMRRIGLRRHFALLQYLLAIMRLPRRDALKALFYGHVSPIFIVAAFFFRRPPLTVLVHGNDLYKVLLRGPLWKRAVKFALRRCDLVLTNSEFNRERILDLGISPKAVVVLQPGVDLDLFTPSPSDRGLRVLHGLEGRQCLLTVGRLIRRKNHRAVLDALAILLGNFPDLIYVVVGDGPERAELEAHAVALGLGGNVLFRGEVQPEELVAWYNSCDIFVLPSRWIPEEGDVEGFGIVFAEAAACAKPVIAGNEGGAPEAVLQGETGLLVPPEDVGALVNAIGHLLNHPEEAGFLGKKGREHVVGELGWARVAEKFDVLVENMLFTPRRLLK